MKVDDAPGEKKTIVFCTRKLVSSPDPQLVRLLDWRYRI